MRFANAAEVTAKRVLKYSRISSCFCWFSRVITTGCESWRQRQVDPAKLRQLLQKLPAHAQVGAAGTTQMPRIHGEQAPPLGDKPVNLGYETSRAQGIRRDCGLGVVYLSGHGGLCQWCSCINTTVAMPVKISVGCSCWDGLLPLWNAANHTWSALLRLMFIAAGLIGTGLHHQRSLQKHVPLQLTSAPVQGPRS